AGFNQLQAVNQLNELTPLSLDVDEAAWTLSRFKSDLAYYVEVSVSSRLNRAPEDVKSSWK
ncbi:hypothetical protein EMCG_06517, partial [[Emmonsia] crescens]